MSQKGYDVVVIGAGLAGLSVGRFKGQKREKKGTRGGERKLFGRKNAFL